MTCKIKRRSLRCGGRPKADFGSIFTTFIAPALGVAGSVADSAISKTQVSKSNTKPAVKETNTEVTNNNNTSVENLPTIQVPTKEPISGLVTSNTIIPSDSTKTPTMRLGGRKKCWIGAAIGAATSIAGSLFGAAAQKREMRRQKSIQDWQNTTQEAANMTNALNNSQDYQEDYLRQFRTAARLGKTLGAKGIYITDGGDATKIGNNTYLLRGGSHEDVNETGQTGIGINVGGNEVEAEGGEVAQKKNGALRIFSAQPILGNGMSPAQAILRGYNKDKVFNAQQAFKKRNGLKDDGSKARNGGYYDWAKNTSANLGISFIDPTYDYRAYYNSVTPYERNLIRFAPQGTHFTDIGKTPKHPTFSNESKYSTNKKPGGTWNGNVFVPNIWQFGNNGNNRRNKYMNNSGEGYFNGRINVFPTSRKRHSLGGRSKAAFGDWVRTNRDDNALASLLYESGLFDRESWNTMLRDIHEFTGMGGNPYNTDENVDAVMAPAFGVPNKAQIIRNVQQANKLMQAAKASQAAQRTAYAAKEAKDFYRGLGINIPVGRNQIYNPTFRSSEIASKIKDSNDALRIYLNNTHLPKGIRLTPVNQNNISRSAARIINPREAEIVRMGIPIGQSAKNMTSGANPFLYVPRNSNEVLEGLSRVISNAKQGAKTVGQRVGNNRAVREFRNLSNKDKAKYIGMAGFAATALPAVSIYLGNKLVGKDNKSTPVQKDAHGKPISQYIARPQVSTQQSSRHQGKKVTPTQKSVVVPKQVNKTVPQYKGNITKGNYQLHDGETRTINGIKYTRRGNTIINHKTNVAYIYDKNGNYTGKADYSKVGNFNQAFDAARADGRSQFIYRAGKYNNYSTIKETNAKKERLNRIVGARRVAKALGGYSLPVKGMRPKAATGIFVPYNKRYTSIYDAPDYNSDYNGGNVLGNGEVTVTAKRIKPTFMKPNNDAMNIINHPANETPYIPQKHNRSRTIFSGGDYLGLGIDTLAALSTGLVNYNTAGKYVLPDRAPIIQASKLPTTYNVNPEIEEVKRYRDRLTGQTFNNTSSSVAALNRSGAINLDALSNLSKLWATKENEENKMLTQDALNQQTVAAQNVQNELARQSEIARIKNEATQAKGDALNVGLSGLSQAWTNFWTAGRTAYEDDQARLAMIASSKDATPTRLMEFNFDLSPDVIAALYRSANEDRTKRFYLSRLSPKQRQKYGIN